MFLVAVVFSVKTGLEQPKTPESFELAFAKIINENVKAQPKHLYQIYHPLLTFLK